MVTPHDNIFIIITLCHCGAGTILIPSMSHYSMKVYLNLCMFDTLDILDYFDNVYYFDMASDLLLYLVY